MFFFFFFFLIDIIPFFLSLLRILTNFQNKNKNKNKKQENGEPIPNIITTVLAALRAKEAQKLEGIFRIAGEAKYLMRYFLLLLLLFLNNLYINIHI